MRLFRTCLKLKNFKLIVFCLILINIFRFVFTNFKANNVERQDTNLKRVSSSSYKKLSSEQSEELISKVAAETVTFSKKTFQKPAIKQKASSKKTNHQVPKKVRKLILLFTNKRSGSSFAGELFNRLQNSFYLFEPLYPFTRSCDSLVEERVSALRALLRCEMDNLAEIYENAFEVTKHSDKNAKCISNGLCFIDRHKNILSRYSEACRNRQASQNKVQICQQPPINSQIISQICLSSKIIAFKILRICDISTLQRLIDELKNDESVKLKIVHLIRDPRAILASRLKLNLDETTNETLSETASLLCRRLAKNFDYTEHYWKNEKDLYFRVRFEDLARYPSKISQQIYDFIEEQAPASVITWLENMMNQPDIGHQQRVNQFDLNRKPVQVVNSWRRGIGVREVLKIQKECHEAMKSLGYIAISNYNELINVNNNLFVD